MVIPTVESMPMGMYAQSETEFTTQANGVLGRDDFLSMLVASMRHQDPLNPVDNGEMIAQMATFSMLESMLEMRESFTTLQSVTMLGKTVTSLAIDGTFIEGTVVKVHPNKGDVPILTLDDGSVIAMSDVQEVSY